MASKVHKLLSTLVFISTILYFLATTTAQECPYPCYPPPTGPGDNPPAITTPPVSTTPPAPFSPPISTTPPAAGYFPFAPPPPSVFGAAQPPPDPVLPWFPYYYRKPPHQDQSSSTALVGSRIIVIMFPILIIFSFVFH